MLVGDSLLSWLREYDVNTIKIMKHYHDNLSSGNSNQKPTRLCSISANNNATLAIVTFYELES